MTGTASCPAAIGFTATLLLAALGAGRPAAAATLTSHPDEESWLAAVAAEPILADFDAFEDGHVLTDDIPGITFSSPNDDLEGSTPVHVRTDPDAAVSEPNVLFGGFILGQYPPPQVIVMDFSPPADAVSFWLGAYNPSATDAAIEFLFEDESGMTLFLGNDTGSESTPVFFGVTSDTPILRVSVTSGLEFVGETESFEEFVLDNVAFAAATDDTSPPRCGGEPAGDGAAQVAGSASDDGEGDTGITAIELAPGAVNLTLLLDAEFTPGTPSTSFSVFQTDDTMDAAGTVVVSDGAGNTCSLPVRFRSLAAGEPVDDEVLCAGEGILLQVSNPEPTGGGTAVCASQLPAEDDPAYPPGYEPSPETDPFPCRVLTLDTPISGDTTMVYKKDGDFDPHLRLLYSLFDGSVFPPFQDITDSVQPILDIVPDPTRLEGGGKWSQVKIACAVQAEICDGIDNDGDTLIDEDLPVGAEPVDADGDGYPLCAASGEEPDCNDQRAFIHPGADEICNGLDDDCDSLIDEDDPGGGADCVVPGLLGVCAEGLTTCFQGGLVCEQVNQPASVDACDGRDEDCDGAVDENYVFGGYLPPVNPEGASIFRRRSVIPLKFRLTDCSGAPVADAVARVSLFFYSSGIVGTEIEDVSSSGMANTDDLYRYDAADDQYIYNLDTTPLMANTSYLVRTSLDDGTHHDVVVSIK